MELISKQNIIDRLDNVIEKGVPDSNGLHPIYAETLRNVIIGLPPAQPELKKGKWIRNGWAITCSECGYDMPYTVRRFCPNCGAEMEVTT